MTQPSSSPIHRFGTSPVYFTPAFSSSSISFWSGTMMAVKFGAFVASAA